MLMKSTEDIMFFTILLGFVTILFLLHYFVRYGRVGRISSRIPGPKAYPIIGNLYHFQLDNNQILHKFWEIDEKFYPIHRVWSFFFSLVTLIHPDDVEVLLKSTEHIEKNIPNKFFRPWLSTGIVTSKGEKWRQRRKILAPTLHYDILKHFIVTFNEETKCLVTSLKEEGKGNPIVKDLQKFLPELTLNVICKTAMGVTLKGNGELEVKYRDAIRAFGQTVIYRITRPWYHFDAIFALSQRGRMQKELVKTLHSFSKKIIAERKLYYEETKGKYIQNFEKMDEDQIFSEQIDENNDNPTAKKKLATLDLLIAASMNDDQLDEEGIREEVDTLMLAGHDTTAMALCFALLLFAKHKHVQERIRNEVNEVMEKKDFKLTTSDVREFSYLERCIKESLRLYPSVNFITRYLSQDLQLKNYLIPAGSNCRISIHSVHRNPKLWPNPDVFDPDRFLPENMKEHNPYTYIPFIAGPRNCIGQKFAMLEVVLMAAYILHHFYLEPVDELDDIKVVGDVILRSSKPLRVTFVPIK